MKKLLAYVLAFVLAMTAALSVGAISLDATEQVPTSTPLSASLKDVETVKDGLGKAVFVIDGTSTTDPAYTAEGYLPIAVAFNNEIPGGAALTLEADPAGSGANVIKVPAATDNAPEYLSVKVGQEWDQLYYIHGKAGKFFMTADLYIPSTSQVVSNCSHLASFYTPNNGHQGLASEDQTYLNDTKDAWQTYVSPALTTTGMNGSASVNYRGVNYENPALTRIYYTLDTDNGHYMKNIALYHYPAGSFMTKDADGVVTLHENVSTFTFATDAAHPDYVWTDGKTSFAQGATAALFNLEYKTFALQEGTVQEPDDSDKDVFQTTKAGLGKAIYHADGNSATNVIVDTEYFLPVTPKLNNEIPGGAALSIVADPAGSETGVIKVPAAADNAPEYLSISVGQAWDRLYFIHGKAGKFFITADIYLPSDSSVVSDSSHLASFLTPNSGHQGLSTGEPQSSLNNKKDTWQTYVSPAIVTTAVEGAENVFYRGTAYSSPALTNIYYALDTDNGHYMKNLALYYYPAYSFFVRDGENETMITLEEGGTYTVPTDMVDELGNYYTTGDEISIADIEYQTLNVIAPKTIESYSIRYVPDSIGMRFPGFVSMSEHDACVEYGFVIALKDALTAANDNIDEEFQIYFADETDGETVSGVKLKLGKAYDGTDYNKVTEDGSYLGKAAMKAPGYYFNAAVIGIPESAYNTTICARTYINIDGYYFYGNIIEKTLADVARSVTTTGAYLENQELKAVVDDIIAKASAAN